MRCLLLLSVVFLAAVCVQAERAESEWPATLLESTALASNKFVPEGRTLAQEMELTKTPQQPMALGSETTHRLLWAGEDARGHAQDTDGNIRENQGRAREPVSNLYDVPDGYRSTQAQLPPVKAGRARRKVCKKGERKNNKHETDGPRVPPPDIVAPPLGPPRPLPPPKPLVAQHNPWPQAPPPENPFPTPARPTCAGLCNPSDADPHLARVPAPPLGTAAIAQIGLEGGVLAKVQSKLKNREGWLRAQKAWLIKAVEAAATIKREIELAEFTRDAVAADLDDLKKGQDALSIKYKADQLKWAFKDKKISMEYLQEEFQALEEIKLQVKKQMEEANQEIGILESTLGPPSEAIIFTPKEIEHPLEFLDGLEPEENFGQHD